MSESVRYQFPLNESMRTYLRIEQLFLRCESAMAADSEQAGLSFFNALFDLIELLERTDVRQDLLKELDQQQKAVARWAESPQANPSAILQLQQTIQACSKQLKSQVRLANCLKDNKFLGSIRQRFSIPGGNCCFDVPQLYQWLHRDIGSRQADMQHWLSQLKVLNTTITLVMQLSRDGKPFQNVIARSGFYQDCAEGVQLLCIECSTEFAVYPTVSGNKHRFTMRFMSSLPDGAASTADIPFKLAMS